MDSVLRDNLIQNLITQFEAQQDSATIDDFLQLAQCTEDIKQEVREIVASTLILKSAAERDLNDDVSRRELERIRRELASDIFEEVLIQPGCEVRVIGKEGQDNLVLRAEDQDGKPITDEEGCVVEIHIPNKRWRYVAF